MSLATKVNPLPSGDVERLRGLGILVALIIVTGWLCGGSFLLTRHLWMDEVHSWLIVTDSDFSHSMQALADGVDFNPPTWFVATRVISSAFAPTNEGFLRALSLLWMLLAFSGLFVMLAKHFSARICIAAVLLTACQPLLIHQSSEIRFYGFWCAAVVWLCCALQWQPVAAIWRICRVMTIVGLSMLIATCHYFGILSLALVATPLILQRHGNRDALRMAIAVIAAGGTALVACLPFLVGQRSALTRPTWISPATLEDSVLFLQTLFPSWQIIVCIAGVLVHLAASKRVDPGGLFLPLPRGFGQILPCLCLAMMPLVIVAVAWTVQPALVTRYAIVGLIGVAPMFAAMLHQCSVRIQQIILCIAVAGFGSTMMACRTQWDLEQDDYISLLEQLEDCSSESVVIFEDRIQWMPVLHSHPEYSNRVKLADFSDRQLKEDSSLRIVQRDVGRRIQKWYPSYGLQSIDSVATGTPFYVVPYFHHDGPGLVYPARYRATDFTSSILRFEPDTSGKIQVSSNAGPTELPESCVQQHASRTRL